MVHDWIFVKSCYWNNDDSPHSIGIALIVRGAFFERIEKRVYDDEIPTVKVGRAGLLPDTRNYQQEHSGRLLSNYLSTKEAEGWTVFSVDSENYGENITVTLCKHKIN